MQDSSHAVRRPGDLRRSQWGARIGLAALSLMLAGPVQAQEPSAAQRGGAIVKKSCGGCHATGESGESPHSKAPLFRTLGQKYPVESLEEALAEGMVTGHPDMPEVKFAPGDVGAIVDYLKSIQTKS